MEAYEVEDRVPVWLNEHLRSRRGLGLVLHGERLTSGETAHLEKCAACNEWLETFTRLARKAGFAITFRIPACPARSAKRAAVSSFFDSHSRHVESLT